MPSPKRPPDARVLAWSGVFYPLVGALLGGVGVVAYFCLDGVLPRSVVMLLILSLWAFLTGALHEDGLADTFDAFGSRRSREDVLRVLKDSRVGSYGSLALILATLLRWQGLTLLRPRAYDCHACRRASIAASRHCAAGLPGGGGDNWSRRRVRGELVALSGCGCDDRRAGNRAPFRTDNNCVPCGCCRAGSCPRGDLLQTKDRRSDGRLFGRGGSVPGNCDCTHHAGFRSLCNVILGAGSTRCLIGRDPSAFCCVARPAFTSGISTLLRIPDLTALRNHPYNVY